MVRQATICTQFAQCYPHLVNPRRQSIQEAFDRHSNNYDEQFSHVAIGTRVREEVWQITEDAFAGCTRILDLGAGTGEDSIHFAQRGIHVTAVDISRGMIRQLAGKAATAGLSPKIQGVVSEMTHYHPAPREFDGLLSNFGAINCTADLNWLRELAEIGLKPGSRVVLTTMGSFYPLEMLVFLLKGQPSRAFRRLQRPVEVRVEDASIRVHYHSLKTLRRELGAQFHLEHVRGLCSLSPAPGWEHLERFRLIQWLAPLDRWLCRFRWTAPLADHFVSVWRYQP